MPKHAWFLDLFVVLVLAAAGRASHELSSGVLGVLATAWPFLLGLGMGWASVLGLPVPMRRWWVDGLVVAVVTLLIGMLLRWLTDQGTAAPFVLVAAGVLLLDLVLVIPVVFWQRVRNPRIRPLVELAAAIPFVLPFIVIAFGILKLYGLYLPKALARRGYCCSRKLRSPSPSSTGRSMAQWPASVWWSWMKPGA